MPSAFFLEDIASRNLFIPDASLFTTPGTATLPNGDPATRILTNAISYYADPTRFFKHPWGTSDWTLEYWCSNGSSAGSFLNVYWLLYLGSDSGSGIEWQLQHGLTANNLSFWVYNSTGGTVVQASTPLSSGPAGFCHVVILCNSSTWTSGVSSSKTITIYKNGTLAYTTTQTNAAVRPTTSPNPRLWLVGGPNASATHYNVGKMAIYDRMLTPTEITDHYLAMSAA